VCVCECVCVYGQWSPSYMATPFFGNGGFANWQWEGGKLK